MNILGVGGWELAVIFIIALIIAGPRRMIQWAYIAGKYLGQLRVVWRNMMEMVQKEFDEAGVDIKLPKDIPTRGDVGRMTQKALEPFTAPMKQAMDEVERDAKTIQEVATDLQINSGKNGNPRGKRASGTAGADVGPGTSASGDNDTATNLGTWSGTETLDD